MADTREKIEQVLKEKLSAEHVEVIDETAQHAGHPALVQQGGGHYRVTIISERFNGLLPVERHRAVYSLLQEELKSEIHALSIKAFTPDQWRNLSKNA